MWKAKKKRETVQYGIETTYKETDIIIDNARRFVTKIKLLSEEIDADFIKIDVNELKELWNSIKNN
ncbi:MAG TPA: hypothetical protein VJH97_01665 [Candidatus Nanoarchaeia archaeon]|nr:hypothetical protein [Candidatus Nanoarchaeia archaeon]